MTPERYQQIGALFHRALAVDAKERAAFLDRVCQGDDELRLEVESLIASDDEASDFIAEPALAVAAELLAGTRPMFSSDRPLLATRSCRSSAQAGWVESISLKTLNWAAS